VHFLHNWINRCKIILLGLYLALSDGQCSLLLHPALSDGQVFTTVKEGRDG